MEPDEEWVYRARDMAPSQHARIISVSRRKTSTRVSIEFLEGERSGEVEEVPAGRLRCPWSQVDEYDARMANLQRLMDDELTPAEEMAVLVVFDLLIPEETASTTLGYARHATNVENPASLERLTGQPLSSFIDSVPSFQDGDIWWLSARGSLAIAEAACRTTPAPILDWVRDQERRCREACKRGTPRTDLDGKPYTSSPDWEYSFYLEHDRPVHELLRQWCGHRAVAFYERLEAAEAEVHRLDELIARAADTFRHNNLAHHAEWLDAEHERSRITPFTIRPSVDRPLDPRHIPVQVIYRKGWWH